MESDDDERSVRGHSDDGEDVDVEELEEQYMWLGARFFFLGKIGDIMKQKKLTWYSAWRVEKMRNFLADRLLKDWEPKKHDQTPEEFWTTGEKWVHQKLNEFMKLTPAADIAERAGHVDLDSLRLLATMITELLEKREQHQAGAEASKGLSLDDIDAPPTDDLTDMELRAATMSPRLGRQMTKVRKSRLDGITEGLPENVAEWSAENVRDFAARLHQGGAMKEAAKALYEADVTGAALLDRSGEWKSVVKKSAPRNLLVDAVGKLRLHKT